MTTPDQQELQAELERLAKELDVPGAMAGVVVDGVELQAHTGVTSVTNPLPVDASTLFQFGSTGKTFTATALAVLEEQGRVDLDAPVRRYVPELVLQDAEAAERVTVRQLLNHTAGWEGDGKDGDDTSDAALEGFVAGMVRLRQETPLGATVSYNNASLSLAGRVVEKVAEQTFEDALRALVLDPLGLDDTLFIVRDVQTVITRRFAVGHALQDDGTQKVSAPWGLPRSGTPAGGMVSTLADQLAWARFHLGEGDAPLSREARIRMQQPTVSTPGSALGDHVGLSWLLKDVDGRRLVSHGGTMIGQYSDFVLVPELGFGFTSLTNGGPGGPQLNHQLTAWALERCCGIVDTPPVPRQVTRDELEQYTGVFETIAVRCDITAVEDLLSVAISIKPGALGDEDAGPQPPIPLALTTGDQYVVPDGAAKGMTGFFSRSSDGRVDAVHLGGRLATRTG